MSGRHLTTLSRPAAPGSAAPGTSGPADTWLHRMAPEPKVAAAVGFAVVMAVTPRRAGAALALLGLALVVLAASARLRPGPVLRRLAVVVPFLGMALLVPVVAGGPRTSLGPVSLSTEGLRSGAMIGAKTVIGALTSIVLSSTTPGSDIVAALGRLRVPRVLVAIAAFMLSYLDLIADELGRRRLAMTARGFRPRSLRQARPLAGALGTTFVRSYERGERVHHAMLSRGFNGTMPTLNRTPPRSREWMAAALLPLYAVVAVAAVWMVGR